MTSCLTRSTAAPIAAAPWSVLDVPGHTPAGRNRRLPHQRHRAPRVGPTEQIVANLGFGVVEFHSGSMHSRGVCLLMFLGPARFGSDFFGTGFLGFIFVCTDKTTGPGQESSQTSTYCFCSRPGWPG